MSIMKLSAKNKWRLKRIVPFGVIWALGGLLNTTLEYGLLGDTGVYPSTKNPYDPRTALVVNVLVGFIIGVLFGALEVLFLNRLFRDRAFWQELLFKTVLYLLIVCLALTTMALFVNSTELQRPFYDPIVIQSMQQFIGSLAFWSVIIYIGTVAMLSLFVLQVSEYLGGSVFNNFFSGKYHHPIEEERIFMFLDIRSSTTIAEQLGHVAYFKLLNQYYADTTDSIIQTSGEVYQYAGDEVIVSWNLENGVYDNNCIRCFFMLKDTFRKLADQYIATFGLVPAFKAGFHFGKVTTGEIGVLKKEIFFTGDVLNTTARIQGACNECGTDILISEDLKYKLDLEDNYQLADMGERILKGKKGKVNLFSVMKSEMQ